MRIKYGIYPTMITPYLENGKIDDEGVVRIVEWYKQKRCDGIFAVCQSSEMFYLTLEERVHLAKTVVQAAGNDLDIIASGHISDSQADQFAEVEAIANTGIKAFVLVTNRFAAEDECDDIWIDRARQMLERFPELSFGLYECPYPYKRLLSPKLTEWCASTGRFVFLKDTCCHAGQMREKMRIIDETAKANNVEPLMLFNANSMTLLESLRDGAAGFSGIMANLHPELYRWLVDNYRTQPEKADRLQSIITMLSSMEAQGGYPIIAKQHMNDIGIPMTLIARNLTPDRFGYLQRETLRQAEILEQTACDCFGIQR